MSSPVFVQPAGTAPALSPNRIFPLVVGVVIALVGLVIAFSGGAVLALFGSDGVLTSDRHALTTSTTALVSGVTQIEDAAGTADVLGSTRVSIAADRRGGKDVFVGIARSADVDRYLAGAAVAEVTDVELDPYRLSRQTRAGTATPSAPGAQDFWVARSSGGSTRVDWKVRDGNYRVVVMNADGSRGVSSDANVGISVPNLPELAWAGIIGGLLVAAGGVAIFFVATRRPRESRPA